MLIRLVVVAPALLASLVPLESRELRPDEKVLWAHYINAFPLELNHLAPYRSPADRLVPYGDDYPLGMAYGLEKETGRSWIATDLDHVNAAGIDALAVNVFAGGSIEPFLKTADSIGAPLAVAPCLDLSNVAANKIEEVAFDLALRHCRLARRYKSAATVNGAPVLFTFGGSFLTPGQWRNLRNRLTEAGETTYWVGDTGAFEPGHSTNRLDALLGVFEAVYDFGGHAPHTAKLRSASAKRGRPFVGSVRPGYYRPGKGYTDARGTACYREGWQALIEADDSWVCVITWNDLAEETQVMSSARWGHVRSDLTAWYGAKWKHRSPPWSDTRLYLSSPVSLRPGQQAFAEALVLNPKGHSFELSVQENVSRPVRVVRRVTAQRELAIPLQLESHRSAPASSTYLATLKTTFHGILKARSAPVITLDRESFPGPDVVRYQTVRSTPLRWWRSTPTVKLDKAKGEPSSATASDSVLPEYLDITLNGRILGTAIRQPQLALTLPVLDARETPRGHVTWGYYGARSIGADGRTRYAPLRFIPPPPNVSLLESYELTGPLKKPLRSQTSYGFAAIPKKIESADHATGPGALFNGRDARIDLTPEITPQDPFEISLDIRPSAPDGTLFADTGGVILRIDKDYHAEWLILSASGSWTNVRSKTPLGKDAWNQIRAGWNGTHLYLILNSQEQSRPLTKPSYRSGSRALGCNPFRSSSNNFEGRLRNYHLRLADLVNSR